MFRAVACASAAALASANAAPQGGNYQQYLDQWAGGFGQAANTGGKDDKKGAGGGSFDYSQYMSGGQGAQAKTSSATALGSSSDYSKYMGGASGGSSMTNSSGSSDYVKKYGDYSKYTGGSSGGGYGNYSKYTDYSKYTSGGSGTASGPKATSMAAVGGGDFMKKYGGGADSQSFVPENTSSSKGGAKFNFSKHVPFDHSKFKEGQQNQTAMSATDCHDMSCLKAWRAAQLSRVSEYGPYVPKVGKDAESDQIKDQYETNKKRIQVEEAATAKAAEVNATTTQEAATAKAAEVYATTTQEAATAKVVKVSAADREPAAVGTVPATPAGGLSASPVEESRGLDPGRWVVLGSVALVAAGMAVRAARARPLSSLPEDPDQAYLALA